MKSPTLSTPPTPQELAYHQYLPDILRNYGRAAKAGRRHALQSLSRVVTLYCEFGMDSVGKKSMPTALRTTATEVRGRVAAGALRALNPQVLLNPLQGSPQP